MSRYRHTNRCCIHTKIVLIVGLFVVFGWLLSLFFALPKTPGILNSKFKTGPIKYFNLMARLETIIQLFSANLYSLRALIYSDSIFLHPDTDGRNSCCVKK